MSLIVKVMQRSQDIAGSKTMYVCVCMCIDIDILNNVCVFFD